MAVTSTGEAFRKAGIPGVAFCGEVEMRAREQAARDEICVHIRSKWPEAETCGVTLASDIWSVLRGAREERICASCIEAETPLCDGRRCKGIITREDRNGSFRYDVRFRRCPRATTKTDIESPFERLFRYSRMSEKQRGQTFAAFNREGMSRDVRQAYFTASGAAEVGSWLVLGGRRGTGKSHLAAAIALSVMKEKGQQAYFRLVSEMLDDLRRGYDDGDHDVQMDFLKSVPCLILDDLGKERSTPAACDYLYQIIDSRYRERRQVIVTTNAASKEELVIWGDSAANNNASFLAPLISRMDEMGDWVFITDAEDYRIQLGKERRANAGKAVA